MSITKSFNRVSLLLSIIALCLPASFFAVRAAMPLRLQDGLFRILLEHPILNVWASVAFVVVLNVGLLLWVTAVVLNLFLVLRKDVSPWLKALTTFLVFVGILGTLAVRSAIQVIQH